MSLLPLFLCFRPRTPPLETTNDPPFNLWFKTNLADTNWAPATPAPLVVGATNVVTNAANGLQNYYRLFSP